MVASKSRNDSTWDRERLIADPIQPKKIVYKDRFGACAAEITVFHTVSKTWIFHTVTKQPAKLALWDNGDAKQTQGHEFSNHCCQSKSMRANRQAPCNLTEQPL